MNYLEKKRESTSVLTDIRNFSETFKYHQLKESDSFLKFIDDYYMIQAMLAKTISDDVYITSTGDGIVSVFLDDNNHREGFCYVLASQRSLTNLCNEFMLENTGPTISFGMGADSGNVWSVGSGYLSTYVGTVINRSSRIESMTKLFAKTTTAIGNALYMKLLKDFYPSFHQVIIENECYDSVLNENPEAVLISKKFTLQYIFDMPLKGIQGDAPIFRVSESLVNDDKLYFDLISKLVGEEKTKIIKEIINI
jgi:class 3 adenylate cyclase